MSTQAYKIRAHHLHDFSTLHTGTQKPEEHAGAIVDRLRADWYFDPGYIEDVIGKTVNDHRLVKDRLKTVFATFVELDDFAPIKITIGEKDGICNGCHLGAHCDDRGHVLAFPTPAGHEKVYEHDLDDMIALGSFLHIGHQLQARGEIEPALGFPIDLEYTVESETEAIPILAVNMVGFQPPVLTNAGFVRAVLKNGF